MARSGSVAPALEVRGLRVEYPTPEGTVVALDGVDFMLAPGETLAVMGESGCGKSTLGRALIGLLPPPGRIAAGSVRLGGVAVERLPPGAWEPLRGREIAMVFQDPSLALNPVLRVGAQFAETVRDEKGRAPGGKAVRERGLDLLRRVGFADPERVWRAYPFQLSGGMRQRAALAVALANRPRVLIADEPTTALDVQVQAQVLQLLHALQREHGFGMLFISHNLAVVEALCRRVAVMAGGEIVELLEVAPGRGLAGTGEGAGHHPATRELLAAVPRLPGAGAGEPGPAGEEGAPAGA